MTELHPVLRDLLAKAFHTARAADANSEIEAVRRAEEAAGRQPLSYEIVVPDPASVAHLVDGALPRLIYFLDCRGARPPQMGHLLTTLFVGDRLYFVRAADLVATLASHLGQSAEALFTRWGDRPSR